MKCVTLFAGDVEVARNLPRHLTPLYAALDGPTFTDDPRVCAELELVPIDELIEPFSLPTHIFAEAVAAASAKSLSLAAVVVAVYTKTGCAEDSAPPNSGLRFICTVPID